MQDINLDILFHILGWAVETGYMEVHMLGMTSRHFQAVVKTWLKSNVIKLLSRNGIDYPEFLLSALGRTKSMIAGPDTLAVWYPRYQIAGRLEVFCCNEEESYHTMLGYLTGTEGFDVADVVHPANADDWETPFGMVYQEDRFGRTVRAVVMLEKEAIGREKPIRAALVISQAKESPLVTVAEMPSTMFMNVISGQTLTVLYPAYTFSKEGLINYDGMVRVSPVQCVKEAQESGFIAIRGRIPDGRIANHKFCGQHHMCPMTIRNSLDNRSSHTTLTMPNGRQGTEEGKQRPLVMWRLRCAVGCGGENVPEPSQDMGIVALYSTQSYIRVDVW